MFGRKKKPWRNKDGVIVCPGDDCSKEKCDDTCPIYLNTQAMFLIKIKQESAAISLYEKALKIAPDFYDALNNLGGIYGGMGQYQKAYNYYLKAHRANPKRPAPVYGLMLTSRDLKKYGELSSWCSLYKTLSSDGAERPFQELVKKKLNEIWT